MTKKADIGSKRLISLSPDKWLRWITQMPDIIAGEILNSDFQWINRENDVLIQAKSREYGDFLVLNELQLRYQSNLPQRIQVYTALAGERYQLPVYPILVNILKESETPIPTRYRSKFAGLISRQDYKVINLWEIDVEIAFELELSTLLPFVPILKGGNEETPIRKAVQLLRKDSKLNELEPLLGFFATFVLDSNLVQQILRWDMAILTESPWYQEILRLGEQRGEQRGRKQEIISGIELDLEFKFGEDGLQILPEISSINDLDKLKLIQRGLKTVNSLAELRELL